MKKNTYIFVCAHGLLLLLKVDYRHFENSYIGPNMHEYNHSYHTSMNIIINVEGKFKTIWAGFGPKPAQPAKPTRLGKRGLFSR